MLSQTIEGVERPIAYMSKSLSGAEKNYSVTERECLAVIAALEHWRCYLDNGRTFTVFTDHSSLRWFLSLTGTSGRLARWGVRLSSFNFTIRHRKGADNVIPDALSRAIPVASIGQTTMDQPLNTTDAWYLNAYQGCANSPSSFPNYQIVNNRLYRKGKSQHTLQGDFEWKEVVPSEFRQDTLHQLHSEPTGSHMGIFKTYRRLSLQYYWPGMYQDTVEFISTCELCQANKYSNNTPLGRLGRPKVCSRPFQYISIDIMGPLPLSTQRNQYIFVVTCCFSKYTIILPMRSATAAVVSRLLENHVFLVHGIPQTVLMDNGVQFISKELNALFKRYKVPNIQYTPKYTPQVNTVERYNRTIITAITMYIDDNHRTWDVQLPKIQFAMNSSINESTGFTPAFLVHGRELVPCGSHFTENDDPNGQVLLPRDGYAGNLGALARIFDTVQLNLWNAHQRYSKPYNLRRRDAELRVGDLVWKKEYFQSDKAAHFSKKLAPKFSKCRVKKTLSPLVVVLEDMSGKDLGSWHLKDLKLIPSRGN